MTDQVDWTQTTFEGSRRAHHLAFLALPFRDKLLLIEQFGEVAEALGRHRLVREPGPPGSLSSDEGDAHSGPTGPTT